MRRYIVVIALLLTGCSGDGSVGQRSAPGAEQDTTTTATAELEATTTAAPTPEPSLAETDRNLTDGEATTTTAAGPSLAEFPTLAGTPPDEFDSFVATMTMSMGMGELVIDVTTDGIWADDAFSCTVSSGLGGITFSESIVATPQQLWIDRGNGYEPTDLFAASAQDIMSSCPTSTLFWSSFTTEDFGDIDGNEEMIGGRPAIRANLTELLEGLGGIGALAGFDGATINEMTLWVDQETNTVLAMTTDMEMSGELMTEFGADGTGPVSIVMAFELSQINDPNLKIELP